MSLSPENQTSWEQTYLTTEKPKKGAPLVEFWYRWTAPKEPPFTAHLRVREAARRGKLTSVVGIAFMLILVIFFTANLVGAKNPVIMRAIPVLWVSIIIALGWFNRRGHSNVAGAILAATLNFALGAVILTSPGGVGPGTLLLFDMLVIVELIVGSTLPVWWIWLPWFVNSSFIVFVLTTWPKTAALQQALASEFFLILIRPIGLHFIITVVVLLWVVSATKAIQRANNAEMVAKLEHDMALLVSKDAAEKEQLQDDIQKIIDAYQQLSNGRLDTRIRLEHGRPLWSLANSMNTWFSRFQRALRSEHEVIELQKQMAGARQMAFEMHRLIHSIRNLVFTLDRFSQEKRPLALSKTDTPLDPIVERLNGRILIDEHIPSERRSQKRDMF